VRLGEIAEVRFGIKTGANDFFYLEPLGPGSRPGLVRVRNGAGWEGEIEEEFLKPVIKSPQEVKTIVIDPSQLKYRIFMCHKSKEELKGTKALEYIEWGERQGYHERETMHSRYNWWSLREIPIPDLVFPKGIWERHIVLLNATEEKAICDQQLYSVKVKSINKSYNTSLYHLIMLLNSSLSMLMNEVIGRRNFGEGILWLARYEISSLKILKTALGMKLGMVNEFINRPIYSIFTEIGIDPTSDVPISEQEPKPLPDRKALDDIVFDALGLTEEERKEVYRAVAQLVWERISKARSVGARHAVPDQQG